MINVEETISELHANLGHLLGEIGSSRKEISSSRKEIKEVRDLVLKQNGQFTAYVAAHSDVHEELGKRLHGLDKADKDATGSIAVLEHEIGKPKDTNGRWRLPTVRQLRESLYLVMILAALAGAAWNGLAAPSKEDIEVAAERADSVASAAENSLKENKQAREELKKVLQALAPLAEMLETEVTP